MIQGTKFPNLIKKAVRSVDFFIRPAALYSYEVLFYIIITGGFFFDFYVPFCLILPYTRPLTLDIPLQITLHPLSAQDRYYDDKQLYQVMFLHTFSNMTEFIMWYYYQYVCRNHFLSGILRLRFFFSFAYRSIYPLWSRLTLRELLSAIPLTY